jgi:hypothetical protein
MKTTYYYRLAIAALVLALSGCTDNFDSLLSNPETVQQASPGSFLNSSLLRGVNTGVSRAHRLNNELTQVTVSLTEGNTIFHRYVIFPSESDYLWSNYYLTLTNVEEMYRQSRALNEPNYTAIALTLKAWLFQNLTDCYGDIPYSQALRGYPEFITTPAFDRQEEIYHSLVQKLDSANALYVVGQKLTYGSDELYDADGDGANILKWKRFTNSLLLRVLMRMEQHSTTAQEKIRTMLAAPETYPLISAVAESAVLKYTGVNPMLNPFATAREYDFNGTMAMSAFLDSTMAKYNDPRLTVWFTKIDGQFVGIPSGYSIERSNEMNGIVSSRLNKALMKSPLLGTILQYAEVEFLLAEAALKGYTTDDPKVHYEKGITASMGYWGATMPNGFLASEGVAYNGTLEQLMTQKYFALFFNDMQQWAEYRRTGYPVLPKGDGLENNGVMPARLKYPLSVQSLNRERYAEVVERIGRDDIDVDVWWAK